MLDLVELLRESSSSVSVMLGLVVWSGTVHGLRPFTRCLSNIPSNLLNIDILFQAFGLHSPTVQACPQNLQLEVLNAP